MLPPRPLALSVVPLFLMAGAAQAQAADHTDPANRSVSSLSIRAVNVTVLNSSACTLEASVGIKSRFVTKLLSPGESLSFSGSGLPVGANATLAKMTAGEDCGRRMGATGAFTNPQFGPPFCLCDFAVQGGNGSAWTEGFSVNQARAVSTGGVGLVVKRTSDSSKFKNFTMTVTGNSGTTLGLRLAPASAVVKRTSAKRALRVRVIPAPGKGRSWRFRIQQRRPQGVWDTMKGSYRATGRKTVRTKPLGRGVFRVKVIAGNGRPGSTSRAWRLFN